MGLGSLVNILLPMFVLNFFHSFHKHIKVAAVCQGLLLPSSYWGGKDN